MKTHIIELPTIKDDARDYEELEKRIIDAFRKEVYIPMLKEFGENRNKIKNSIDDLVSALMSGQINFYRGRFVGKWQASLSRELKKLGAVWDRKEGAYKLTLSKMPVQLRSAVLQSETYWKRKMESIDKKLADISSDKIIEKMKFEDVFDSSIYKFNESFKKQLKQITVMPEMSQERRDFLTKSYSDNLKLDIKGFIDKTLIPKLRSEMEASAFKGLRAEAMVKHIQESYGTTVRKAKFLASQETKLLMTSLKEQRYTSVGIKYYAWRCVTATAKGHEVRPRHKELNDLSEKGLALLKQGKTLEEVYSMGLIFRYDNPPVCSDKGQKVRRANAGADFNCRCNSRSLLPIKVK